ncbi:von Willebrand factor type A domain protein [Aquisphaera giovannonii]|uniref:von Willebrand factor type A domain protein n=2 Tax=Aquisphaera giovannonii TaxID=406548 RepID=A0A5B9VYJ7_9BACT|nr:von Willebrand factor type A domain protein [Aquisphaera giovannonii]
MLLALVPLGFLLGRGSRARLAAWRALAQRGRPTPRRSWSVLLALVLIVLALARPRFGSPMGPAPPPGHDVVLLMDVSRSMAAEDAVPSRLAVAIESALSLLNALAEEPASRAAVVAFAGRGMLRYPMTENLGAVADVLGSLRPGSVQPGGTDLGAGLAAAVEAFGKDEHLDGRSIIMFSDGEDHRDRWQDALERLTRQGVAVHVVAIGDAENGHEIPSGEGASPLTYDGKPVKSRRVDESLTAIAKETGGATIPLGLAATDLGSLYRERIAPAARLRRQAARVPERPERFPYFLATALGFVLSASWPPGRPGPLRWAWNRIAGGMLLAFVVVGLGAGGTPAGSAHGRVKKGELAYRSGDFEDALAEFEAASALAPREAVPRYDAAAALFQLRRFPEAARIYREARELAGEALRVKIDYALGNTALAMGDIPGAVEGYDRCIASAARGAGLDAIRADAAENRRFAIEQAPPSVTAQGDGDDPKDQPRGGRKAPRRPEGGDDTAGDDPGGGGPNAGGKEPDGEDEPPRRPPNRRRRVGGAGGSGKEARSPAGESPDDRLDEAVDEIRDALNRRLSDDAPAAAAVDNHKDW